MKIYVKKELLLEISFYILIHIFKNPFRRVYTS